MLPHCIVLVPISADVHLSVMRERESPFSCSYLILQLMASDGAAMANIGTLPHLYSPDFHRFSSLFYRVSPFFLGTCIDTFRLMRM